MVSPPTEPKAVVFVDGQNLFQTVKTAFGYTYPNYDILALAKRLCGNQGWTLAQARFYTGTPDFSDNPFWNDQKSETQYQSFENKHSPAQQTAQVRCAWDDVPTR